MFAAEQASHSMYLNDQVNRKNTNKKYVMTSQVKLYSLRFWACGSPTIITLWFWRETETEIICPH